MYLLYLFHSSCNNNLFALSDLERVTSWQHLYNMPWKLLLHFDPPERDSTSPQTSHLLGVRRSDGIWLVWQEKLCVCLSLLADTLKKMSHLTRVKCVHTIYISAIDLQSKHKKYLPLKHMIWKKMKEKLITRIKEYSPKKKEISEKYVYNSNVK
jgi:hypothetical protein